jgi:predicted PurR-regulated permease PerM
MRMVFTDRNVRRIFVLGLFLALLCAFRHLAVLLVFFVLFERALGSGASWLNAASRCPSRWPCIGQIVLVLGASPLLGVLGYTRVVPAVPQLRAELEGQFHHLRAWLHARGWEHTRQRARLETLVGRAQHYAGNVVGFVGSMGKNAIYVLLGLILSVVFLLERDALRDWRGSLHEDSVPRILMRYFSYLCDAIAITAKLQVIVAFVNTVITLPVLLALGLPSIPALMAFLFIMGLIPVVGGVISGVVMGIVAFTHKGFMGVAVFFVSTFVLHKIESYYLSPRLTAQHVKLPGFVIITSLILFEHAFGLVGLFISFPALYVAARIRESWRDADLEHADERTLSDALHLHHRTPGRPPPPPPLPPPQPPPPAPPEGP